MIAASPATNPERSPGRLERFDRLWKARQRRSDSLPIAAATSSSPGGGAVSSR